MTHDGDRLMQAPSQFGFHRAQRATPRPNPQVKRVVKVNIGQQRRCTAALRRTFLHARALAILQHAGVQPYNSEGMQYDYLWTEAGNLAGNRLPVVTYQVAHTAPEGRPGRSYLNLIREAAHQRSLPADYIAFLDRVEARE